MESDLQLLVFAVMLAAATAVVCVKLIRFAVGPRRPAGPKRQDSDA